MSLYLCIFQDDEDVDGVDVGHYADFDCFRANVLKHLEKNAPGSRFPTLMLHSDCDGEWSPTECRVLEYELKVIRQEFQNLPPVPFQSQWQVSLAKLLGHHPTNLHECFIDVDGELLIDRLVGLCQKADEKQLAIVFQ